MEYSPFQHDIHIRDSQSNGLGFSMQLDFSNSSMPTPQTNRITFQELSRNQNKLIPLLSKIRGVILASAEESERLQISRQIIEQSFSELQVIEDKLEELKSMHSIFFSDSQFAIRSNPIAQDKIKNFHNNIELLLKQHVENAIKIFHTLVLDSYLLDKLNAFHQKIRFLYHQFAIYQQELLYFLSKGAYCCFSKLFILYQPEPLVIFKGKCIETPLSIVLLSGCFPKYEIIDPVQAKILDLNLEFKKDKVRIENNVQRMDSYQRQATFNSIKINASSAMKLIHLSFTVKIKQYTQAMTLESEKTNPIIVITHENQWIEAQINLFTENCFQNASKVSWCCFINNFHNQFLTTTKQCKSRPDRSLTLYEIRYLHKKKFNSEDTIEKESPGTTQFLQWMGKIQRTIHFKRHIHSLWTEGYVFPILSKQKAEKCLESQGVGTFLLRFSDSQGGLFAIAYCSEDQSNGSKVKHYLVKNDDLGANKTLPDFLQQCDYFQYILKVDVQTAEITRMSKECLSKYYSKKKYSAIGSNGYTDTIT